MATSSKKTTNNTPQVDTALQDRIAQSLKESNAYAAKNGLAQQTLDQAKAQQQSARISVDTAQKDTPVLPTVKTNTNLTAPSVPAPVVTPPPAIAEKPKTFQESAMSMYEQTFKDRASLADERAKIREEQKIAEKNKTATDLYNRLTEQKRNAEDKIAAMRENPQGMLEGQLEAQISDYTRRENKSLADLSFAYQVANGDLQGAEKIVSERLADLTAQRNEDLQLFNTYMDFMRNDMSDSEKQLAQQKFQIEQDAKNFEQQKELARYNAQLEQADPLYQVKLAQAKGGGGLSIEDRIKLYDAAEKGNQEAINMLGYNPNDLSYISPEKMIENENSYNSLKEDINKLDSLLQDKSSLASVTGVLGSKGGVFTKISTALGGELSRFEGGGESMGATALNKRADFINTVEYVVNNFTFDKLLALKESGATFGALSENELKAISSAASRLGTAANKTDGKITGFTGSAENLVQDINFIKGKLLLQQDALSRDLGLTSSEQLEIINIK